MQMVSKERVAAALEGKIKSNEPDYRWAKELCRASSVRNRFLSQQERSRETGSRMQLLEACSNPQGSRYGGIADLL